MAVDNLFFKIQQDLSFFQALAEEKNLSLNFQVEQIPGEGIEVIVDLAGEGTEYFDQTTITCEKDWTDFSDEVQLAMDVA